MLLLLWWWWFQTPTALSPHFLSVNVFVLKKKKKCLAFRLLIVINKKKKNSQLRLDCKTFVVVIMFFLVVYSDSIPWNKSFFYVPITESSVFDFILV